MKTRHWTRIAHLDLVGKVASVGALRPAPGLAMVWTPGMQSLGIECVQGSAGQSGVCGARARLPGVTMPSSCSSVCLLCWLLPAPPTPHTHTHTPPPKLCL